MEIKILGTGCLKCKRLTALVEEVLEASTDIQATIIKVTDLDEIMELGVMTTPGLVIDGEVVSAGRLPRKEEIEGWLRASASKAPAAADCCCECDCDDDCECGCDCDDDCDDDCECDCHTEGCCEEGCDCKDCC